MWGLRVSAFRVNPETQHTSKPFLNSWIFEPCRVLPSHLQSSSQAYELDVVGCRRGPCSGREDPYGPCFSPSFLLLPYNFLEKTPVYLFTGRRAIQQRAARGRETKSFILRHVLLILRPTCSLIAASSSSFSTSVLSLFSPSMLCVLTVSACSHTVEQ